MGNPFASFRTPIVGQEKPPTADEMAADLAEETCLRLKELKAEALAREQACEPPMLDTEERAECYKTLESLMKGRHRWIVLPILFEQFPEMVTPATLAPGAGEA